MNTDNIKISNSSINNDNVLNENLNKKLNDYFLNLENKEDFILQFDEYKNVKNNFLNKDLDKEDIIINLLDLIFNLIKKYDYMYSNLLDMQVEKIDESTFITNIENLDNKLNTKLNSELYMLNLNNKEKINYLKNQINYLTNEINKLNKIGGK